MATTTSKPRADWQDQDWEELRPIERIVRIAGGQRRLARLLGISRTRVHQITRMERVPADWVVQLEKCAAGLVKREDLRPDLYE